MKDNKLPLTVNENVFYLHGGSNTFCLCLVLEFFFSFFTQDYD